MGGIQNGGSGRLAEILGRRPLFFAALVAVAGVFTAAASAPLAAILVAVLAAMAARFCGWRTGIAWWLAGSLAVSVFLIRDLSQRSDERELLAFPGGAVEGVALKDAKVGGENWRTVVKLNGGPRPGAKVWWEGRGEVPVAGSKVKATGNFSPLEGPRNPGEFDQASWLRSQGVSVAFRVGWVDGSVKTGAWAAWSAKVRRGFRDLVTDGLDENSTAAAVIRAVVIGERPPDAEELIASFRNSGTLHAFSVSGLHVTMVAGIGWFLLRWLGVSRRRAVLLLVPMVFIYSWITGNSPPAVRSAWMAAVFLGAFVSRRRPDLLNSLGVVLLVATLWDGRLLFLPGVQLSYGVVAAISLGMGISSKWFSWMARPPLYVPAGRLSRGQRASLAVRQHTAQSLEVSVVAAIGSTPLTAWHFGLVTPVSILAGLVIIPIVFFLLIAALTGVMLHPVLPAGARLVNRINAKAAGFCVWTAERFSSVPGGHFQIGIERKPLLVVFDYDRGAGAACFSDGNGAAVLLDAADPYEFKRRMAPSLRRMGIYPDAAVFSHPDGNHLGGGAPVWEEFPIQQVLLPVEKSRSPAFHSWLERAPQAGIRVIQAATVRKLPMPDAAWLEILSTPDPRAQNALADNRVMVFRLHWRGWKVLFTGDMGMSAELDLVATGKDLSADVIIAGHHSGDVNLCDLFLERVRPQAILASHSDFPPTERLDPKAVAYWRSQGIRVMPQGETGCLTIRVDEHGDLRLEGFADKSLVVLKRRR